MSASQTTTGWARRNPVLPMVCVASATSVLRSVNLIEVGDSGIAVAYCECKNRPMIIQYLDLIYFLM